MKELRCRCGRLIQVDDEDFEKVNKYEWSCIGKTTIEALNVGALYLTIPHIVFLTVEGVLADHKSRDIHDNQKQNLRPATRQQNTWNQSIRNTNTSGYKGVNYHKTTRKWRARIMVNGQSLSLGLFETAELAGEAYNKAAKLYFGQFAFQNQIQTNQNTLAKLYNELNENL